jgi:hypothetical protein
LYKEKDKKVKAPNCAAFFFGSGEREEESMKGTKINAVDNKIMNECKRK